MTVSGHGDGWLTETLVVEINVILHRVVSVAYTMGHRYHRSWLRFGEPRCG